MAGHGNGKEFAERKRGRQCYRWKNQRDAARYLKPVSFRSKLRNSICSTINQRNVNVSRIAVGNPFCGFPCGTAVVFPVFSHDPDLIFAPLRCPLSWFLIKTIALSPSACVLIGPPSGQLGHPALRQPYNSTMSGLFFGVRAFIRSPMSRTHLRITAAT